MKYYPHPIVEQDEIDAVNKVLKSGMFSGFRANQEGHLGGSAVIALEDAFKAYHNIKYAISFNSATSALHTACIACSPYPMQNEFLVSPFTFSASASCVRMARGIPVFADIDEKTFCIDTKRCQPLYDRTKCIIPVHLMGHPADMGKVRQLAITHNLKIIEDACQALGAEYGGVKVGTLGDCGVFSFNQSKPISCGEGGMLITNDDKIAEVSRAVRNHGEVSCPDLKILGYNYRMGEMEAALALAQFRKLDERNNRRIELANHLTKALHKIWGLTPPYVAPDCKHVYYTYGVKYDQKKIGMPKIEFQQKLIEGGVYFGLGNQKPLHLYPFYGGREGQLLVAERISRELMFTDILRYPMTIENVDEIIDIIKDVIG